MLLYEIFVICITFLYFCVLYKSNNIGNTWEVNVVKFEVFWECVWMLYRGGSDILMGVGTRFRGVLSFSIVVLLMHTVFFLVIRDVYNGVFTNFLVITQ